MDTENKIKRHGYHLMSLASAGMFCVTLFHFVLLMLPYFPEQSLAASSREIHGFTMQQARQLEPGSREC